MRFPNVRADVKTAFEMYHTLPYFTAGDIRKLFNGCSGSTASKIAKLTRDEMTRREIKMYCEHDNYLNKDVLYDLAGLDINSINKSYKMLERSSL